MFGFILLTHIANISYSNATTITGLFQWANSVTGGILGLIIDAALWVLMLFGGIMLGQDIEISGLAASFISIWVSIGLIGLQILNPIFITPFIAAAMLFFILTYSRGITRPYG